MRIDACSPKRVAISLVMDSGALLNLFFFFFLVLGGGGSSVFRLDLLKSYRLIKRRLCVHYACEH